MYYIIVGAGDIGTHITHMALDDGHDVALIEQDDAKALAANSRFDALVLHADIAQSGILAEAGADRADCLIATTGDDSANLMAMFLGTEQKIPLLISIVNEPGHKSLFERLGVKTFFDPDQLVAQQLYRMVRTPSVQELVALPNGGEMVDVTVGESTPLAGLTLAEAAERKLLPPGMLIVALRRGKTVTAPNGATKIQKGDHLTVFVEDRITEGNLKALTG